MKNSSKFRVSNKGRVRDAKFKINAGGAFNRVNMVYHKALTSFT